MNPGSNFIMYIEMYHGYHAEENMVTAKLNGSSNLYELEIMYCRECHVSGHLVLGLKSSSSKLFKNTERLLIVY